MTIAETVASVRTLVPGDVLRDALTACLLSAGADGTLPTLMSVQVEKKAGCLIMRSTDRFRLTRVTVTLDTDDMPSPDWTVLVASDDAKRMVTALPKSRKGVKGAPVALTWLEDAGRDYLSGREVHGLKLDTDSTGMHVQERDGDYPRVDSLIPSDESDTVDMGQIGLDAKYLTDLAKMPGRGKNEPVRLRFRGAGKGVVSTWGDETIRYEHLLMPVRLDG